MFANSIVLTLNNYKKSNLFYPKRWGLSLERIRQSPSKLRAYWEHYRANFQTKTRDTSELAYAYLRGQLTMEQNRHFAGIARQINQQDGQALQHFCPTRPGQQRAYISISKRIFVTERN